MERVQLSIRVSAEARPILKCEAAALVDGYGERVSLGLFVTEMALWADELHGEWDQVREEIKESLSEKAQERRRKDRERKRCNDSN
jgi:hypothetical protein